MQMKKKQLSIIAVLTLVLFSLLTACAPEVPAENPGVPEVSQETKDRLTTTEAPGASAAPSGVAAAPQSPQPGGE